MTTRFSLVYPTCNRPHFIEMAIHFLSRQDYENFEIIVSDNYTDFSLSCLKICETSPIKEKIRYVKPPKPLGMIENWNYALQFAKGDYISFFTDKNFLLPGTLNVLNQVLSCKNIDIASWKGDFFTPKDPNLFFTDGVYQEVADKILNDPNYNFYEPHLALEKKSMGITPREEQDYADYVRGKINFGCYRKGLIERIENFAGKLFHNISPDYTSMILGLSCAEKAIEFDGSAIVQVNADISNGALTRLSDSHNLSFLKSLDMDVNNQDFLVPGLYASQNNMVCHDYLSLKRKFELNFRFDQRKWLESIAKDLMLDERIWSSDKAKAEQEDIFQNFLKEQGLPTIDLNFLSDRETSKINVLKRLIPAPIKNFIKKFIKQNKNIKYKKCHLIDLLIN